MEKIMTVQEGLDQIHDELIRLQSYYKKVKNLKKVKGKSYNYNNGVPSTVLYNEKMEVVEVMHIILPYEFDKDSIKGAAESLLSSLENKIQKNHQILLTGDLPVTGGPECKFDFGKSNIGVSLWKGGNIITRQFFTRLDILYALL